MTENQSAVAAYDPSVVPTNGRVPATMRLNSRLLGQNLTYRMLSWFPLSETEGFSTLAVYMCEAVGFEHCRLIKLAYGAYDIELGTERVHMKVSDARNFVRFATAALDGLVVGRRVES